MRRATNPWFPPLTLAHKLTAISMATTAAALALVCAVLVTYDNSTSRRRLVQDIAMLADVVGRNSAAALTCADAAAAGDILAGLGQNEHIVSAVIVSRYGGALARFDRDRAPGAPARTPAFPPDTAQIGPWSHFTSESVVVSRPVF